MRKAETYLCIVINLLFMFYGARLLLSGPPEWYLNRYGVLVQAGNDKRIPGGFLVLNGLIQFYIFYRSSKKRAAEENEALAQEVTAVSAADGANTPPQAYFSDDRSV